VLGQSRCCVGRARLQTEIFSSPVEVVANQLADEADLLCFDEFQITDIQDAVILPRIFQILGARGTAVVATSNTAPEDLFSDGLNRHVYLPPLQDMLRPLRIVDLNSGAVKIDHRKAIGSADGGTAPSALIVCPRHDTAEVMRCFGQLTGGAIPAAVKVDLPMGRSLMVPHSACGVALLSFDMLCAGDRSESDFIGLARVFHTVVLTGVPVFTLETVDWLRRFVKLLDILYDRNIRLVVSAEAPVKSLFQQIRKDVVAPDLAWRTVMYSSDGRAGLSVQAVGTLREAAAATFRAQSRMVEMQTQAYWDVCRE